MTKIAIDLAEFRQMVGLPALTESRDVWAELQKRTKEFVDKQNGLDYAGFEVSHSSGHTPIITISVFTRRELRKPGHGGDKAEWKDESEEHVDELERLGLGGFELDGLSE